VKKERRKERKNKRKEGNEIKTDGTIERKISIKK
jgi:hypothetical protein